MKTWKHQIFIKIALIVVLGIIISCTPKRSETQAQADGVLEVQNDYSKETSYMSEASEEIVSVYTNEYKYEYDIDGFPITRSGESKQTAFTYFYTNGRLLETMRTLSGGDLDSSFNFVEYDKSRFVMYHAAGWGWQSTYTITYNDNDLIKTVIVTPNPFEGGETITEINFIRNANTITVMRSDYSDNQPPHIITLNDEGYMVKLEWSNSYGETLVRTYQYQNGNLVKMTSLDEASEMIKEYEYSNSRSPFYNNNTPKWYLVYYFQNYGITSDNIGLRNNIISERTTERTF